NETYVPHLPAGRYAAEHSLRWRAPMGEQHF
ncbi:unnamed protein product, partial [marine sediment metagenome]